jgi:heme/copper-type cytochrome/quinol oxidase subunit 2
MNRACGSKTIRYGSFACFLFLASLAPRASRAQETSVQVVELTAKKYEFAPLPVHVKAGMKVQARIHALDHDHGFKISVMAENAKSGDKPGLLFAASPDCVQLKKGETTTIEFVAQTQGTYAFKCCHTCGLGHGKMKGQFVVE